MSSEDREELRLEVENRIAYDRTDNDASTILELLNEVQDLEGRMKERHHAGAD